MLTSTAVTVQAPPSPAPAERPPISGWGIIVAVVSVIFTIIILTKIINSVFGGGSNGKPDRREGWW